jgi:hypothetical protein
MTADAVRWSCARCGVSVGRIDSKPAAMPDCWTEAGEQIFCLGCSRALAGEAATDAAPDSSSGEELVRIRRNALIKFEIHRDPEAANRTIARACHTSPAAVAAIRDVLVRPEAVAPVSVAAGDG